jgi:hypothetical protein
MNKLREQYCDEINTPMGLDNVYDYVKWLETKLNKQVELLQFIQTAVVGQSEQLTCKTHPYGNTYTSITGALCCVECFEVIKAS